MYSIFFLFKMSTKPNKEVSFAAIESVCPRMKEESLRAYIAFTDYIYYNCNNSELQRIYANTKPGESLPPTRAMSTIQTWSLKFNWQKRKEEWLRHKLNQREEAMLLHWEEHRDRILNSSRTLLDKAEQMLKQPIVRSTAEQDGKTIIIEPSRWGFRDAATFMEVSTKLTREAVGDDIWAKDLLRRKGYHVFEPGMGDIAIALNSLVAAKIIPYEIVPRIINAIKESEMAMSEKIQNAFNMVIEDEYYKEVGVAPDVDNDEESDSTVDVDNIAAQALEMRNRSTEDSE